MTKKQSIDTQSSPNNVTKKSIRAMGGVILSRFSGVVRSIIVNAAFGAHVSLDAFYAAFRFPNSLRDLFADGALSSAFTKVLVDARNCDDPSKERKVISILTGFFLVLTLLIALLGAVFAGPFIHLMTSDKFMHSGGYLLAVHCFQVLAFYLPITMLNAIIMAMLGVEGMTFRAMNGTIFLSLGMIIGSLFFSKLFINALHLNGIYGLVLGAMIGVILQFFYQAYPFLKEGRFPKPTLNPYAWKKFKPLHEAIALMIPRAISQGALTFALLINTKYAIQIGSGIMTYIFTAILIIQVPIGLFGVATSFSSLPTLSDLINKKKYEKYSHVLRMNLETALYMALWAVSGFALLIVPFYQAVFQHGKITYHDTIMNSFTVCSYSIGIMFSSGSKVLLNSYYALNKTKLMIFNAFIYFINSAIMGYFLSRMYGVIGLGISYGTSTAIDFFLNFFFVSKVFYDHTQRDLFFKEKKFYFKIGLFSFLSYFIPFFGILVIKNFWSQFHLVKMNSYYSWYFLVPGGIFFVFLGLIITRFWGPEDLKTLAIKATKGLFLKNKG